MIRVKGWKRRARRSSIRNVLLTLEERGPQLPGGDEVPLVVDARGVLYARIVKGAQAGRYLEDPAALICDVVAGRVSVELYTDSPVLGTLLARAAPIEVRLGKSKHGVRYYVVAPEYAAEALQRLAQLGLIEMPPCREQRGIEALLAEFAAAIGKSPGAESGTVGALQVSCSDVLILVGDPETLKRVAPPGSRILFSSDGRGAAIHCCARWSVEEAAKMVRSGASAAILLPEGGGTIAVGYPPPDLVELLEALGREPGFPDVLGAVATWLGIPSVAELALKHRALARKIERARG